MRIRDERGIGGSIAGMGGVLSKHRPLGEGGYSSGTSWVTLDSLLVTGLTYRFVEV
jgi:hypothetical protein